MHKLYMDMEGLLASCNVCILHVRQQIKMHLPQFKGYRTSTHFVACSDLIVSRPTTHVHSGGWHETDARVAVPPL